MKYKVEYANTNNARDLRNKCIIKRIFSIKVECANRIRTQIPGIGSRFENFQKSEDFKIRVLQILALRREKHNEEE